jgi:tetratricopeptide (TPR) repeat protein
MQEYFSKAQVETGLQWNVTGVLGKRTKFQQFETSQLAISAISNLSVKSSTNVPTKLQLNDDTLLEHTEFFTTEMDQFKGNLNPLDQSILLSYCLNVKNTNPDDGLTTEQMLPYVARVLENPNNWSITTMALLLRSRLEAHRSRTVERSCLQLQTLVDQWREQQNDASPSERMLHVFSLLLPSKWEMEKELGLRFISIGVMRSALEIFERLELWENAISCHQMLEQPKKAEELIQKLLEQTPESPKLWCLLGDVQGNINHFQKAWDISNHKYSRAMRSLGARYFQLQEWQKSIDCYEQALAINPLFENSWFVMGCASLRVENYNVAANAFGRVTQLDSGNSEAWNNLASVHIKTKKLVEAFGCLKEAIKVNYEAANIWENYLFVSVDIGEFAEAIRAMERIFAIRIEKHDMKDYSVDEQVLEIIVTAVNENVEDANGQPCSVHAKKLYSLLELITSKYSSHTLYLICAIFYRGQRDFAKSLEFYERAYRLMLHNPEIMESPAIFAELAKTSLKLADAYYEFRNQTHIPRMGSEPTLICANWAYQSKMALKSVIGRTKVFFKLI